MCCVPLWKGVEDPWLTLFELCMEKYSYAAEVQDKFLVNLACAKGWFLLSFATQWFQVAESPGNMISQFQFSHFSDQYICSRLLIMTFSVKTLPFLRSSSTRAFGKSGSTARKRDICSFISCENIIISLSYTGRTTNFSLQLFIHDSLKSGKCVVQSNWHSC